MRKLIACALLIGALAVSVHAGIPTNIRVTAVLTPGGKVDSRYRDGNDGTAAVPITWTTVPTLAGVQGTPQTINLRTLYVTEPGSPNSTFTFDCVPTLAGGWTTTTDGLSFTYSSAYSGVCQVTATRSASVGVSNFFSVTSTASASADSTAPSQVLGVTATQTAGIHLSWRASSDPKVTGQTWSGLSGYKVYRDGSGTALATVNAPDTGFQVQLTGVELGASTGGSVSQSGANYTLASNGNGIGGTSEEGYFAYQSISGDFRLCAEIHALTGGDATNGHVALNARQSTAADDLAVLFRENYTSIRARSRGATGQTTATIGSQINLSVPAWLCESRTGTTWVAEYSTNGVTFTKANTTNPSALSTALLVGFLGGNGGGAAVTVDLRGVILTAQPDLTYDDAISDGASHSYIVKAIDGATNLSVASVAASATAPGTADSTGPAAPTNIVGSAVSTSVVQWTWTPPTDPSGIASCTPATSTTLGGTYTDQSVVTNNTFQVTGLSASTARYLKVKCTDGATNVGTQSTPGVIATSAAGGSDTTPPSVPSGNCYVGVNYLRNATSPPASSPCATGLSTSTFRIKTTGSTDAGVGVADYRLYMSSSSSGPFLLAATFVGLQYDFNLGSAQPRVTKYFKLTARDANGNESAQSNTFYDWTALASGGTPAYSEQWDSSCPTCGTFPNNPKDGYPYMDTVIYPNIWSSSSDSGCNRAVDNGQNLGGTAFHYKQNNQPNGSHCMIVWQGPVGGGANHSMAIGKEYNYAFNAYLKGSTWTLPNDAGRFVILNQLHGDNSGTANNPHMSIDAGDGTGNHFLVKVLGDTSNQKPYERNISYFCSTITEDTWHKFEVQVRFGDATSGYTKIYHNDELCVWDTGLNYFQVGQGPYTSVGVYNGWANKLPGAPASPSDAQCLADPTISVWCTPKDGNREGYVDSWVIGRGDLGVGYQEVVIH